MRKAMFRQRDQRDWGLPAFTAGDLWRNLYDSAVELVHDLFVNRRESRRLRRHLAGTRGPVLVSLGSGRIVPPGWVGLDLKKGARVFRCDLRKPLPFADGSIDGILAEHVMEHFCADDLPGMLAEIRRVLRPGAPLRIVSPDAAIVAALLGGDDSQRICDQIRFDTRVHGWDPSEPQLAWRIANRLTYQFGQHRVLLTAGTMTALLADAGFIGIQGMPMTQTVYFGQAPGTHLARFPDSAHEAFTLEAVRPPARDKPASVSTGHAVARP